jgi:hypothetical protein
MSRKPTEAEHEKAIELMRELDCCVIAQALADARDGGIRDAADETYECCHERALALIPSGDTENDL